MVQDTAAQDNITGAEDVLVAAGLADPQYGYANFNSTFGFQIPDGDFYNLGSIDAGSVGTIYVGGALDEISVFVVRFLDDGSQVLASGNGIDDQAIFTADASASTWALTFTADATATYFVAVVDQTDATGLGDLVSQSVPYVLSSSLADAEAQSASYQSGSFDLTGTSGAEGSFTVNGSEGGTTIDPDEGQGISELIELSGTDIGELLNGSDAADLIRGMGGNDSLLGGLLADILYGNQGADVLYGNQDDDTLFGGQDADTLFGGQLDDVTYGNFGDDAVYGNAGSDVLYGGQDNDLMYGGQGDDQLFGNRGDDLLAGNLGADTLTGGSGADRFLLTANQGADIVTDFSGDEGDTIVHTTDVTVTSVADGVLISADDGDGSLTLLGINLADFESSWLVDLRVA